MATEGKSGEDRYANVHEDTAKKMSQAAMGNVFFDMMAMDHYQIGPHYSSAQGAAVEGKKIMVVLVNKVKGTGSRLHTHGNEQFNYVLKGQFKYRVNEVEGIAGPNQMVYIPANAQHYFVASGEGDGMYLACKDTSDYVSGEAVDGTRTGAYRDPESGK